MDTSHLTFLLLILEKKNQENKIECLVPIVKIQKIQLLKQANVLFFFTEK